MQNRLKSKVLWTTSITLIVLFLKNEFDIELTSFDSYLEMAMIILVELGIINNPKNNEGW
jgi:uncharacterized membrane protein